MTRVAVVDRPLDLAALAAEVSRSGAGAIATFVGVVRDENDGKPVAGIDYTAYHAMAVRELETIVRATSATDDGLTIVAEHRVGTLAVGEASVIVAASHPHRGPALAAVQDVVESLKRRVPIWKREHYIDGTREWVGANASSAAGVGITVDPLPAAREGRGVRAVGGGA